LKLARELSNAIEPGCDIRHLLFCPGIAKRLAECARFGCMFTPELDVIERLGHLLWLSGGVSSAGYWREVGEPSPDAKASDKT
jgi:hypothetical protein